jgi:hypothetical protein
MGVNQPGKNYWKSVPSSGWVLDFFGPDDGGGSRNGGEAEGGVVFLELEAEGFDD